MLRRTTRQLRNVLRSLRRLANSFLIANLPQVVYERVPNNWRDYEAVILNYVKKTESFFFVQIGSNDGVSGDPIHKYVQRYGWSGILVEPVKYLFDKLRKNYETQDNLVFENAAISDEEGLKNFYSLTGNPDSTGTYDQLGSLIPEVLLGYEDSIPNIKDRLVTERVRCITFSSLLRKHQVSKIDLLQIDTEGYDYRIVRSIDFESIRPKMILYEHNHLSDGDRAKCEALLTGKGYVLIRKGRDTFAFFFPRR